MSSRLSQHSSDEIELLKQQLAEKDKIISELRSKDHHSHVRNLLNKEIDSLQESAAFSDPTSSNIINNILNEPNLDTQITSLFSLIKSRLNSIPRLCAQLRGHVDFLSRLASTPELQTLFLISDHNGQIFLPETARQLLLEQAARTSQLISEYPEFMKTQSEYEQLTINDAFQFNSSMFNANKRISSIHKLLQDVFHDPNELSSLLIQEVLISSSFQRVASNANDAINQIHSCLNHAVLPNENHNLKQAKKLSNNFEEENGENLTNQHYDEGEIKINYHDTIQLAQKVAKQVSRSCLDRETSQQENHLLGTQHYCKESRSQHIYNNEAYSSVRCPNNKFQGEDWIRWAKHLYHGLTKLPSDTVDDVNLRIVIEEAALTSIGTQVLQNKLRSLRIQKCVMAQPHVEKYQNEISFRVPLICVTSCLRMISNAYTSNAYTTKKKVLYWSKKPVFNK